MSTEEMNPEDLASLRKAAEEGRKATRELAFAKAGVSLDTPLGDVFMKGYDGELDPDKIKAAWGEIAPTATIPQVPAVEQSTEPTPQTQATPASAPVDPRVVIQQGGNVVQGQTPDLSAMHPGQLGAQMFHEVKANPNLAPGVTPQDMFFSSVFGAASKGDPRATSDASKAQAYRPS